MEKKVLGSQSLGLLGGISRPKNRLLEASVSLPTLNLFSTRNGVPPQLSRYVFVHVFTGREMIVLFLLSATSKDSVSSSASSLLASWEEVSHCRRWLPPPVTHPSGAALHLGRLLVLNLHPFDN